MSLALSPIFAEWERLGLKYKWIITPKEGPFAIKANGTRYIPSEDYTFQAKEGIMAAFNGTFDHPLCGIKIESGPNYDSKDVFVVRNYMFGSQPSDPYVYALVPPYTLPGFYGIKRNTVWKWEDSLRLSLINTDSMEHTCLGYGYQIVMLTGEKGLPLGEGKYKKSED